MRKLWKSFLSWCDVLARVRAARELSSRGMYKEAAQIMNANYSNERK